MTFQLQMSKINCIECNKLCDEDQILFNKCHMCNTEEELNNYLNNEDLSKKKNTIEQDNKVKVLKIIKNKDKEQKEVEQQEPVAVETTIPEKEDEKQKEEQKGINEFNIRMIQALVRKKCYKEHNLPNSIKMIHKYLENYQINNSSNSTDGRRNSCIDEDIIIEKLKISPFKDRLYIPKPRHWFDIAIMDYQYGWLPINIKSTTTKTADNTGNLAMCVYSLTDYDMDLKKSYQNGKMSKIFIDCLKNKRYNKILYRDYYFIVVNKENGNIISNSVKGLNQLTPNINNLPFQVKWSHNRKYNYKSILCSINMVKKAIQRPKKNWKEEFLDEMRGL